MSRVCVITEDGGSYYAIASRLRSAGLPFLSLLPGDVADECSLVLTTRKEAGSFTAPTLTLEELDEDPDIARSQVLARLSGERTLLVGVDPGLRIGTAAFMGDSRLASRTFNSRKAVCAWIAELMDKVPSARAVVRVGDGDPKTARWIADALTERFPRVTVEIVDESGTSSNRRARGLQRDQGSAARIAFRRGAVFREEGRASKSR